MKTPITYILGFGLSILFTLAAFGLVEQHLNTDHVFPSHEIAVPILVILAIMQLFVQLILFLHMGEEQKPRWNLTAAAFALIIVVILVGGTLWIMHNLQHMQEEYDAFSGENISPHTLHE